MRKEIYEPLRDRSAAEKRAERLHVLAQMRALTSDSLILAGIDRIEAMMTAKWPGKNPKQLERAAASLQAAQSRTRSGAKQHGERWSDEDQSYVLHSNERDEEIALRLCRTLRSVRTMRDRLRKQGLVTPNVRAKLPA
jgi:hypothetical protein